MSCVNVVSCMTNGFSERGVGMQEWKEHLERQLDSILGKVVCGTLRVLRGHRNRLHGGAALLVHFVRVHV